MRQRPVRWVSHRRAADGGIDEQRGIPVDAAVSCFAPADLARGRDPALDPARAG